MSSASPKWYSTLGIACPVAGTSSISEDPSITVSDAAPELPINRDTSHMQWSDADAVGSSWALRAELPRVLILTASARRRGAELQATQLSTELRRRGVSVVLAA